MKRNKKPWTKGEKWLWVTPVLLGAMVFGMKFGPNVCRRVMGIPQQLDTISTNSLTAVVLSRNGSVLAATGRDDQPRFSAASGTVYLWDAQTLLPLKSFAPQHWNSINSGVQGWLLYGLSLSPDGKLIGMIGRGAEGYAVYEVNTQKLLWRTVTNTENAEFSADGRFVALGQFELREARTGKLVAHWNASNGGMTKHFSLSPDGKTVVWIGARKNRPPITSRSTARPPDGKTVEIRRSSDGKLLRALLDSQETEAVFFSPDGQKIISIAWGDMNDGSTDGCIVRCHSKQGKLLWQRDFRKSNPANTGYQTFCDAAFSPDGQTVSLRGLNSQNELLILNVFDGSENQRLPLAKGQYTNYTLPQALAVTPDGKRTFVRGKSSVLVSDIKVR